MFKEALPIYKELIVDFSKLKRTVPMGESLAGLAQCQMELKNKDEALSNYLKAIEVLKNERKALAMEGASGDHTRRMFLHCFYSAAAIQKDRHQFQEAVVTNKEGRQFDDSHPDELYSKLLREQEAQLKRITH